MAKKTKKAKQQPQYKSFRVQKRIKHDDDLPSSWGLFKTTFSFLRSNIRPFGLITLVYGLLYIVLVQTASSVDLLELRDSVEEVLDDQNRVITTTALLGVTLGASANISDVSALYGMILAVITSLAIIWAIRQALAGKDFRIKDAFYKGMYPIIPFVLLLLLIFVQLLPFAIGGFLFATVLAESIAVTAIEKLLFGILWLALSLLSAYWLSSSVVALYIVTLPNMTPMEALGASKKLVGWRRWQVFRRILMFGLIWLVIIGAFLLATLYWLPSFGFFMVTIITVATLSVAHVYFYNLYRVLV